MGNILGNLTWQQYTGEDFPTFVSSLPGSLPMATVFNGYFLNYTSSGGDLSWPPNPIVPNTFLGNFFFTGSPGSSFLAVGPHDASMPTPVSALQSFTGTAIVPEPSTLILAALGGLTLLAYRRRR